MTTSERAQWRSIRQGGAVADVAPRGVLEVVGPDALTFLQGQTSNDVLALGVGQGCPLVFANPKGGVLADATCYRTRAGALLEMERDRATFLAGHLARYLMLADAQLLDRSDELDAAFVTGLDVAAMIAERRGDSWLLGTRRLGRVPCTLVLGAGPRPGRPVSQAALEVVRIEEGVPRYGFELDVDNLPQNALLDEHICFDKGCFTGQEPIARLHYRGKPARELRGLVLPPDAATPCRGAAVHLEGEAVGAITSCAMSPGLGAPIAMAYLRRKAWGAEHVDVGGTRAEVRELPLYPAS